MGERGKLFFDRFKDTWVVKPGSALDGFEAPDPSIPRTPDEDNYKEWRDLIEGKVERGRSDFAYAGPFTETVFLGCFAEALPSATRHAAKVRPASRRSGAADTGPYPRWAADRRDAQCCQFRRRCA